MILAIDTATRWTGLALFDGRQLLAEHGWRSLNNQTVELAPTVQQVLARAGLTPAELSAVSVAIGPGSYTGLRIGLGFAKGLSLANQTALVAVPTLDIVAAGVSPFAGRLIAVVEAGRTRVCAGPYTWQDGAGWQSAGEATITTWEELLQAEEEPVRFAGEVSPTAAKQIRTAGKSFSLAPPTACVRRAGHLAEIGWKRLRRGWTDDPAELAPLYLRDPAGAAIAQS
ncbi:MAG: tRNA (adenosine(37)-N6)-threonylcarbamoyltransferase complex dimerization subunit type 1 TsaB [Candidatus Promineifilaceae bacterium]|nr:tRNA (adenosine(37)-N6)-threonylcarbamoyltransferase complex dimerization subunit type 1 TsaB [Candidatus Promineifilaceae bacterium]